ncbi:MAG: 3-phosphoshikimate 1-carboxyvinyltransferase [Candidatus Eisenbacteria bacterium]|nr:3-phosphoshikimate 1-carboxyvinyltransferase [Candidatus Latescibacterota bacterium]MBD3302922.1 3-phosphoshikimate 1-carboxyvinyltransferase [Candidatus Eisenbacteria bacterium]
MSGDVPRSLRSRPAGPLRGTVRPIGDKSLTHRGLILASLARGRSTIREANPGEDCRATAAALGALGARVAETASGWEIDGTGGRLRDPEGPLDLGNSGTGIRLLTGLVAGAGIAATLTGDDSLRKRPMGRIAEPLRSMGASIALREERTPPIVVRAAGRLRPLSFQLPIASAQVKSAILLAGLGAEAGEILVEEPGPSRDHTERMLAWRGVGVAREDLRVRMRTPAPPLAAFDFEVPGDPSAAAFYAVAASLVPGSDVLLEGVGLNPTRTGALEALASMGAAIEAEPREGAGPEPIGTIRIRAAKLRGTVIAGPLLVRAIDEVPVLAVAAAAADGETWFRDAGELRVKESDRIESTAQLVRSLGVEVETGPDWIRIVGRPDWTGGTVDAQGDHRIAMSALVAGCRAAEGVRVDDVRPVETSDPRFLATIASLGADLS